MYASNRREFDYLSYYYTMKESYHRSNCTYPTFRCTERRSFVPNLFTYFSISGNVYNNFYSMSVSNNSFSNFDFLFCNYKFHFIIHVTFSNSNVRGELHVEVFVISGDHSSLIHGRNDEGLHGP